MHADNTFPDDKYISAYTAENTDFYLKHYQSLKSGRSFTGFNIAGLIFPLLWLTYRKLYLYAFIFFIIQQTILSLGHYYLPSLEFIQNSPKYVRPLITNLSITVFNVLVSIYGTKIYLSGAVKKINHFKSTLSSEQDVEQAIQKSGGTSNNACFWLMLFLLVINLVPLIW